MINAGNPKAAETSVLQTDAGRGAGRLFRRILAAGKGGEREVMKKETLTVSGWTTGDTELRIGFIIVGIVLALGIVSVFYTPHDVYEMNTSLRSQAPSLTHFFGTDNFGRDVFSRAMVGARFTLLVSASTILLATGISILLGLACGYIGGMVDEESHT